jgi:glycosyltransferase involved in cell wall biosynthesis
VRVALELADGLLARGLRVEVAGPHPAPDWHPLRAPYRQAADLAAPGALPAADVCIATFWTTVEPAMASGARHVLHLCQGFEGVHREYSPLLRSIDAAYRLPLPKLVVSPHLVDLLVERYGSRCHLIGSGVDPAYFHPPADPEHRQGPLRIGVVGAWSVRPKGVPTALAGLDLARRRGHDFELWRAAGEPLTADERELGITARYRHRLTTREMGDFYRQLDTLVFPSADEEGFGLPVLEAMACGVAVAASDIAPLRSLPHDALQRFPPGDPQAIADAVGELLRPATRAGLAARGRAWAAAMSVERVVDRLLAALVAEGVPVPRWPDSPSLAAQRSMST